MDLELPLHPSLVPAGVDVVTWRRAAETDAFAKRPADRLMETRDLVGAQRAGLAKRVDPRAPQRLDRIDVPDPRDRTLIEKQHFDGSPRATPQERAQPRDGEAARERLLPK